MKQDCAKVQQLPEGKGIDCYAGQFDKYEGLTVNSPRPWPPRAAASSTRRARRRSTPTPPRRACSFLVDGFKDGTIPKQAATYEERTADAPSSRASCSSTGSGRTSGRWPTPRTAPARWPESSLSPRCLGCPGPEGRASAGSTSPSASSPRTRRLPSTSSSSSPTRTTPGPISRSPRRPRRTPTLRRSRAAQAVPVPRHAEAVAAHRDTPAGRGALRRRHRRHPGERRGRPERLEVRRRRTRATCRRTSQRRLSGEVGGARSCPS